MKEKYLVVNAGSSSLKFALYNMPDLQEIANGYVEKIGKLDSFYTLKSNGQKIEKAQEIMNHTQAVEVMLEALIENGFISDIHEIKGIGHRILHGGEYYSASVVIDDAVLNNIISLTKFGPLHHPGEIAGILSMKECLPTVPQVAVFDTSFHQTIPKENYMYAVPYNWYEENKVRKYGFHGTSHKYITQTMQKLLNKKDINLIICHIGSGASVSCIKNGLSFNTTMGLTPLDGLIMGTRCGSIDSSIIEFICKERNLTVEEVNNILNTQSGLQGLAGKSDFRDLRELANKGYKNAKLAIKMFENSLVKYIAEYYFALKGKVDALVFTAGIGENDIELRESVVNSISDAMDVCLDEQVNSNIARSKENRSGIITTPNSKVPVYVIPTNEEAIILNETYQLLQDKGLKRVRS